MGLCVHLIKKVFNPFPKKLVFIFCILLSHIKILAIAKNIKLGDYLTAFTHLLLVILIVKTILDLVMVSKAILDLVMVCRVAVDLIVMCQPAVYFLLLLTMTITKSPILYSQTFVDFQRTCLVSINVVHLIIRVMM